jgi:membrane-associated phospholipid phosphatase
MRPSTALAVSSLALAVLVRRVARRQTEGFDRQWAARIGNGGALADRVSRPAQPRNGFIETLMIACLPRLQPRERAAILCAPLLAGLAGHALKRRVPRDRPGRARLSPQGEESFPSTHAASAASLAIATAHVARQHGARWTNATAMGIVSVIALARLRAGAHWPTDVVAGALLGIASAEAATIGAGLAGT